VPIQSIKTENHIPNQSLQLPTLLLFIPMKNYPSKIIKSASARINALAINELKTLNQFQPIEFAGLNKL
jgi:hypothetical protein